MAARPRIGVTGNQRRWAPSWWCTALALRLAGAIPERISLRHAPSGAPLQGLVIGGGNDIGPEHYGGDINAKVKLDPERDKLEIHWIRTALEQGLPLLGICRGAQLINVILGGSLHQDIRHLRLHTHNRPGLLPTKGVRLEPASRLAAICNRRRLWVNSLHHQAVDRPGQGLRVVGRDRDEITQAIEAEDGRCILGVQWHPEYLFYLPAQMRLFRWLLGSLTPDL
ncbi:MAG: gamma-glutamyl-gamma-aminobutyrate hydrolase family protein [Gammaproteobacteria bacterium SHHR-1]|uniref:gamma-glutamyl-gamma-aminobutyrate hydrolase family protein n=1 Tax=Magnetovirga frankeli TaxID=947516 RepID=UPI00129314C2|nr:gamma-glutamyl-gamma-aminobutyrate hydrolase family protein [gamma proteobacterium SS-5]